MTSTVVRYILRNGLRLLLLASALCIGVAVAVPGQSPAERLRVLAFAATSIAVSYGFFRVVLTLLVTVGEPFFGRIALWYAAFVLYAGIAGVPLALLSLPFQWHDLYTDGMTAPLFVAMSPVSLAASLAAARVIEKRYVAV